MTDTVGQPVVLSPSPRHMRKRRFLGDVPPSQVPGQRNLSKPAPTPPSAEELPHTPPKEAVTPAPSLSVPAKNPGPKPKKATPARKRVIALIVVILVSISIPLLVLTLMFAG